MQENTANSDRDILRSCANSFAYSMLAQLQIDFFMYATG